jgi:hypothetical protein
MRKFNSKTFVNHKNVSKPALAGRGHSQSKPLSGQLELHQKKSLGGKPQGDPMIASSQVPNTKPEKTYGIVRAGVGSPFGQTILTSVNAALKLQQVMAKQVKKSTWAPSSLTLMETSVPCFDVECGPEVE